jgi:hypothetical protein
VRAPSTLGSMVCLPRQLTHFFGVLRSWLAGKDKILSCNPNDRGYLSHDEIIKAKIYFCDGALTPSAACTRSSLNLYYNLYLLIIYILLYCVQ